MILSINFLRHSNGFSALCLVFAGMTKGCQKVEAQGNVNKKDLR